MPNLIVHMLVFIGGYKYRVKYLHSNKNQRETQFIIYLNMYSLTSEENNKLLNSHLIV